MPKITSSSVYNDVRAIAEGKIACECGNKDWLQFVYVGSLRDYLAACKRCGRSYWFLDSEWKLKGGPFSAKTYPREV